MGARPGLHRALATARGVCQDLGSPDPSAVRLNRAEFAALAGAGHGMSGALRAYAFEADACVGLTGETDLVTDGARLARIANGHPLMAKVTAMGCARRRRLSRPALRSKPIAWLATATALMVFGVAGEIAGARATGPGSFAAAMLDALYALDGEVLVQGARVAC